MRRGVDLAQVQPPPTRTVRAAGSTSTVCSRERSRTTPSSQTPSPPPLWPPPRTASSRSWRRAKEIVSATSALPAQRAISAGPAVDHRVVDRARLLVAWVFGTDQLTRELRPELCSRCLCRIRWCSLSPPLRWTPRRECSRSHATVTGSTAAVMTWIDTVRSPPQHGLSESDNQI